MPSSHDPKAYPILKALVARAVDGQLHNFRITCKDYKDAQRKRLLIYAGIGALRHRAEHLPRRLRDTEQRKLDAEEASQQYIILRDYTILIRNDREILFVYKPIEQEDMLNQILNGIDIEAADALLHGRNNPRASVTQRKVPDALTGFFASENDDHLDDLLKDKDDEQERT